MVVIDWQDCRNILKLIHVGCTVYILLKDIIFIILVHLHLYSRMLLPYTTILFVFFLCNMHLLLYWFIKGFKGTCMYAVYNQVKVNTNIFYRAIPFKKLGAGMSTFKILDHHLRIFNYLLGIPNHIHTGNLRNSKNTWTTPLWNRKKDYPYSDFLRDTDIPIHDFLNGIAHEAVVKEM